MSSPANCSHPGAVEDVVEGPHVSSDTGITSTMDSLEREQFASPDQSVSCELADTPSMELVFDTLSREEERLLASSYSDGDSGDDTDVTVGSARSYASVVVSARKQASYRDVGIDARSRG